MLHGYANSFNLQFNKPFTVVYCFYYHYETVINLVISVFATKIYACLKKMPIEKEMLCKNVLME